MLATLRERGVPESAADPISMSDEMRSWAHERVQRTGTPQQRLEQLLLAILRRDPKPFKYLPGHSAGVREAWESGRANCLAFSHLFIAMAREVGLEVYYLRVRDLSSFGREGDLVVSSDHVTAAWGPGMERRVLDFADRPVREYHQVEQLSDITALALHYSNLGAERIRAGELGPARELLETAVQIDAELADGWVNLGVARRRLGDLDGSEAAYRRALESDPQIVSAYHNLSALLALVGRTEESQELLELVDRRSNRNPWSYLALGDLALRQQRLEETERLYRRAQRLAPDNPETVAALGQWALAVGRARDAKRYLRRAEALDAANPRVAALARQLRALPASS